MLGAYNRSSESRKGAISQGWGSLGGFLEWIVQKALRLLRPKENASR